MLYPPVEPLLVNKQDAAKMLGIGQTGLNRLIRMGKLVVVELGPKCPRLSVKQIKALVAEKSECPWP